MMQTKFLFSGSNVSVVKLNTETARDLLPAQVYTVQFSELAGFSLSIVKDQLQVPEKIYGSAHERVEKCITTYKDRTASTGVLLTGDKGTGKTLTLSLLANKVITDLKLPVILIREPFNGEQFEQFIQMIGECCLIFDEFGKMYSASKHDDSKPSQEKLLSLFDGVDKTKRLLVLTENHEMNVSEFMLNRPSRIYYHFKYAKLEESSTRGYCSDHNVPENVISDILELSRRSKLFSFDMLQTIVEEYMRFGSPVEQTVEELNIDIRTVAAEEIQIIRVIDKNTKNEIKLAPTQKTTITRPMGSYV